MCIYTILFLADELKDIQEAVYILILVFFFFFPLNHFLLTPCPNSGLPCGSAGKESTCNAGDLGSIILKSTDLANKGPCSQIYGFSSSHVWM